MDYNEVCIGLKVRIQSGCGTEVAEVTSVDSGTYTVCYLEEGEEWFVTFPYNSNDCTDGCWWLIC